MQILGIGVLALVIAFGFSEREGVQVSAFDLHALVLVLGGTFGAILTSSGGRSTLRTFLALRELLPFGGTIERDTERLEDERVRFADLWREGRRSQAVELAEGSAQPAIRRMLKLVLARAGRGAADTAFMELRHDAIDRFQPPTINWELMARLGPSFGMVGTIAGMIQLFQHMGEENLNIGAAISLALVTTLYGIAFGAGVAGPIGHHLRNLLDQRLGALDRCHQNAIELAESGPRS